ncbi:MAG: rhomboid family intramembrane serine protease [Fibrobacterota bacterium]
MNRSLRISFNAPVTLIFTGLAFLAAFIDANIAPGFSIRFCAVDGTLIFSDPLEYLRLFSHILGHSDYSHLFGNLFIILLLGPILEEKYGTVNMLLAMIITALATALLHILFFSGGLMGASGIVFLYIVLASIVNLRRGTVPLSFILVFLIFIGGEGLRAFQDDNISQMAHIIGGLCGAFLGFALQSHKGD